MGLRHWSYVAMLAFCLVGTLPLARVFHLSVLRQPVRLIGAIALAAAPFVAWDLWATHVGQWQFDPAQTLPPRVGGLPVEELGFFVVIPLASILTYEAVRVVRHARRPARDQSPTSHL